MKNSELFYELTGRKALYNIMPIANIPSVTQSGILSYNSVPDNHISVADPDVQDRRDKYIPGGKELHSYANLYFDPRNPMMYRRRNEYKDLCILAITAQILDIDGVVVTDQNAATSLVKFIEPHEMQGALDFDIIYMRDWNDSDYYEKIRKRHKKCAEVLVPDNVPYSYIIGAYVADNETEQKLRDQGFDKRIKVNPDKFFK